METQREFFGVNEKSINTPSRETFLMTLEAAPPSWKEWVCDLLGPTWKGPTLVGGIIWFWTVSGEIGNGIVWEGCGKGF